MTASGVAQPLDAYHSVIELSHFRYASGVRGNHLIREARRRAGLTQTELAARVGTTQSAIARLERGYGHPTMQRISELVEACGLELQVRLVPSDEHDWSLVARNAALDADERVARAMAGIRLAEEVRRAGERHRAESAAATPAAS